MGYKGTAKKIKEIGRELEVGSVLEGSFRKAGNKIRVTPRSHGYKPNTKWKPLQVVARTNDAKDDETARTPAKREGMSPLPRSRKMDRSSSIMGCPSGSFAARRPIPVALPR